MFVMEGPAVAGAVVFIIVGVAALFAGVVMVMVRAGELVADDAPADARPAAAAAVAAACCCCRAIRCAVVMYGVVDGLAAAAALLMAACKAADMPAVKGDAAVVAALYVVDENPALASALAVIG